jgi:hypothetical protein
MKIQLAIYLVAAWLLAPLLAGLAAWPSVWGGGSAALDYLLPLPISGGVLHLPSLLGGALLLVLRQRGAGTAPWWGRVGAAAMAGAGAALLIDLSALAQAWHSDSAWPLTGRWLSQNPLGLFLLVDGLLALLWPGRPAARPSVRTRLLGVLLALGLPLLLLAAQWRQLPVHRHELLIGASRPGPARGDETTAIYTRLPMQPAPLADALARQGLLPHPRDDVNVQDQALVFFDSLADAQRLNLTNARLTWCRYEDGSAERWIPGAGDCFGGHRNFSERLAERHSGLDPGLSPPVRSLLARWLLCQELSNAAECSGLAREREQLRGRAELSDLDREALRRLD